MNSLKLKILTDHQEIHITFAFQITGAVGGCRVGAQPLQLLMMFPLITVFMIKKKNLWSWPECAWHTQAFQESSPVTGRIILYTLNHEQSQEPFHCGFHWERKQALPFTVELGLSWLNHCVPEIPRTQIHTWKTSVCWYIIWKYFVLVSDKLMRLTICYSAFFQHFSPLFYIFVFYSCWWWGAWHCLIYLLINSFFTE